MILLLPKSARQSFFSLDRALFRLYKTFFDAMTLVTILCLSGTNYHSLVDPFAVHFQFFIFYTTLDILDDFILLFTRFFNSGVLLYSNVERDFKMA